MGTNSKVNNSKGFTLIEMIGVIAVVAILGAFVAPKVFKVIKESKGARLATDVNTYSSGVARWYKDIGTLQSLNSSGVATTPDATFHDELMASGGSAALWAKWDGPYIDSVANTPIGTTMTIGTIAGTIGTSTPSTTDGSSFDLSDDGKNQMTGRQVVYIKVTDVSDEEFSSVDDVIDNGISNAAATSGKVKYDSGTDVLHIYLQSL